MTPLKGSQGLLLLELMTVLALFGFFFTLSFPSLKKNLHSKKLTHSAAHLYSYCHALKWRAIVTGADSTIVLIESDLKSDRYTFTPPVSTSISLTGTMLRFKPWGTSNNSSITISSSPFSSKVTTGIGAAKLTLK